MCKSNLQVGWSLKPMVNGYRGAGAGLRLLDIVLEDAILVIRAMGLGLWWSVWNCGSLGE